MARLGQQEQADLLHVCAGGDVNEIIFFLRTKGIVSREVMELAIHLLEIPGVFELLRRQPRLRARRNPFDVSSHAAGNVLVRL